MTAAVPRQHQPARFKSPRHVALNRRVLRPRHWFWPTAGQVSICVWLGLFDFGMALLLVWQIWGRK